MTKKATGGNPAKKSPKAKAKAKGKVTVKPKATAKAAKAAKVAKSLTTQQADKIVGEINKLAIETVERGQMDIGDLVLKKVFQGSLDEAISRNPYKSESMKQIVDHASLRVDRRRLGEWVRAAFVRKELMAIDVDCSNLSYSHFAALLKVDDEKKRKKLAAEANKGQWSARTLIDKVDELKVVTVTDGMTPVPDMPPNMTAGRLLKALANPRVLSKDKDAQKILANPQLLESLPYDVRKQVRELAEELVRCMVDSVPLLKSVKKNFALMDLREADVIDVQADVV